MFTSWRPYGNDENLERIASFISFSASQGGVAVYCVKALDSNGDAWVKIGHSSVINQRIRNYNYAEKFRAIGIVDVRWVDIVLFKDRYTAVRVERFLQRAMSKYRAHYITHEWFTSSGSDAGPDDFFDLLNFHFRSFITIGGYIGKITSNQWAVMGEPGMWPSLLDKRKIAK